MLIIISFIIKFSEPLAVKTSIMIEIISLILLISSKTPSLHCDKLWGYWVSVFLLFAVIMTALLKQKF
jgi:hypothetical protein